MRPMGSWWAERPHSRPSMPRLQERSRLGLEDARAYPGTPTGRDAEFHGRAASLREDSRQGGHNGDTKGTKKGEDCQLPAPLHLRSLCIRCVAFCVLCTCLETRRIAHEPLSESRPVAAIHALRNSAQNEQPVNQEFTYVVRSAMVGTPVVPLSLAFGLPASQSVRYSKRSSVVMDARVVVISRAEVHHEGARAPELPLTRRPPGRCGCRPT